MNMKPEIQQLMINVQQYHMNKFNEILCYKCITQKQEEWNIPYSTLYTLSLEYIATNCCFISDSESTIMNYLYQLH